MCFFYPFSKSLPFAIGAGGYIRGEREVMEVVVEERKPACQVDVKVFEFAYDLRRSVEGIFLVSWFSGRSGVHFGCA